MPRSVPKTTACACSLQTAKHSPPARQMPSLARPPRQHRSNGCRVSCKRSCWTHKRAFAGVVFRPGERSGLCPLESPGPHPPQGLTIPKTRSSVSSRSFANGAKPKTITCASSPQTP